MIDYARMQRTHRAHKAALTRATKSGSVNKVLDACKAAIREWDEIGCWPDDWHRWQIALNDALPWHSPIDLQSL